MAFCSFVKDSDGNSYTVVENKFITKYLPEADPFAVKVYLYGLYLCGNCNDFTIRSMAEVLQSTEEEIAQAFALWEDYDLVQILSKEPFAVQYLPVKTSVGKPKRVRYEQYSDFNKELQRKMQRVGKFVSSGDYLKFMHFLEENDIRPQALLLVAEYCINKQGESVSPSYIFNKAKKLIQNGCSTYEQVEKALSNYNAHEKDLLAVFNAMALYQRAPEDGDYALYKKWTEELGFRKDGVLAAAKRMKRGTMASLDLSLEELAQKGKTELRGIENYLTERELLGTLTLRIARKLGVKVNNTATFIDEYTEKWYTYGFEDSSLLDMALFCLKSGRSDFNALDELVGKLFAEGIVSKEGVKEFLKGKNDELKLFNEIEKICGTLRKNATNLSMVQTWRDWKFSNEMILEAAKRSAASASPIPYMNKILSDWKRGGVYALNEIPSAPTIGISTPKTGYVNPAIEAVNAKSDRERYYALLREKAQTVADRNLEKANKDKRFKQLETELSKMEISLAKAEVFEPDKLPSLQQTKTALIAERKEILTRIGITEEDLTPQFTCKKCSDTGFLKSGKACDCYKTQN
ncbi:MAG: DnaD domain protein [Clostridia bacterium]|nr:DnaD domain protein [Clostridia bacterium]